MRREHGFTLIELLIAATLMIIVIGATLTTFEQFNITEGRTQDQNDAQASARNALDLIVKQMRNHASPAPDQQQGIDKYDPSGYDVAFQTVDKTKPVGSANSRNVMRVRYCLDYSVPTNERLWMQTQTWTTAATPALPSTSTCPDPAWPGKQLLVDHLVNAYQSPQKTVFKADSSVISHISQMRVQLITDRDTAHAPPPQQLDSTVAFRNENLAPVATFTYLVSANGSVALNASGSYDPEGDRVTYTWSDGTDPIGEGLAFTWDGGASGTHTITLTATDESGLSESTSQQVTIP